MTFNAKTIGLIIISIVLSSFFTFFFSKDYYAKENTNVGLVPEKTVSITELNCDYSVHREKGYQFIKPIQYIESECESKTFASLKKQLEELIAYNNSAGHLNSASVYLCDFEKNSWTSVNGGEGFHPGSLMKLALLITFLKQDERNPGFLNTKVTYNLKPTIIPHQTYNSKQIEFGKSYTIKELLKFMISYSDNNATMLLHSKADLNEYRKTFDRIGLTVPNLTDRNYSISAKDYGVFFTVLYDAGFLTIDHSEFAMELLSQCDFKEGMSLGLPQGTQIAHKFGEWSDGKGNFELHESAIIYLRDKAFLLVIMSKGKDVKKLSAIISDMTRQVYQSLN